MSVIASRSVHNTAQTASGSESVTHREIPARRSYTHGPWQASPSYPQIKHRHAVAHGRARRVDIEMLNQVLIEGGKQIGVGPELTVLDWLFIARHRTQFVSLL